MTLATVSFQNYFRLYKKLSGMTGTAFTEAEEFQQIYSLDVVQIPSNKPIKRDDQQDLIFRTEKAKLKAIADVIVDFHKEGRPVLVGSASIAKNELIAEWLKKSNVPFEILNAKNNEREASIIEKAGEKGAITLATNIAGRGTDIKLGDGVADIGGLVVIGSERHESRRIDNQLRGRGGRQGDPGLTQFYVSTEDDLMRIFQGERISTLMGKIGMDDETPIQHKMVSNTLEAAQKRVEGFNFDIRKNVVQYDNVINRHRRVVYTIRRKILEGADIKTEIERLIEAKVRDLTTVPAKNNKLFNEQFEEIFPLSDKKLKAIGVEKNDKARYELALKEVTKLYKAKEDEVEVDALRKVEREVYLQVLDTLWMQHLENMQHLRDGIHWRSVGQRDPLVEYRSEAAKLFESLQETLRDEVLRAVTHVTARDAVARAEERHETELTRLAESAVEKGVNEITSGEANRDGDFSSVKKAETASEANNKKNAARKKKKSQRQNRKTGRK
jgi:preprotein translocase subunit SecA